MGGGGFGTKPKAGGFGGGKANGDSVGIDGFMSPPIASALNAKLNALQAAPEEPQSWLEVGAVLVKAKEYAEAERVFRKGAASCPGHEMLSAAALTLGGDSEAYWHGEPIGFESLADGAAPPSTALAGVTSDDAFEAYETLPALLSKWDQADRAFDWSASGADRKGAVFRSRESLIPPEECAEVIRLVEAHAERSGGWSTARHVQAPTTDVPVSEVPELRKWFDDKLEKTLFPMLAARYPSLVPAATDLRVMDAFVVRYDANAQASLPVHQDENSLSFTIALNDATEYEGGGTCFESLRPATEPTAAFAPTTLNAARAGGVVAFPGKLRHGGAPVTKGRRYIIPLFIYGDTNASGKKPGYLETMLPKVDAAEGAQSLSRYAASMVKRN